MPFQEYAPAYPMGAYPQQPVVHQPRPVWQGQPGQTPVSVRPVAAQTPATPRPAAPSAPAPIVRAQSDDEPASRPAAVESAPVRLQLPSPEQLGLAASAEPDWTQIHKRLEQLGATGFHLDQLPTGKYRVNCLLPTGQSERTHRIEVESGNKAEAVRLTVTQAEDWTARQRNNSNP